MEKREIISQFFAYYLWPITYDLIFRGINYEGKAFCKTGMFQV